MTRAKSEDRWSDPGRRSKGARAIGGGKTNLRDRGGQTGATLWQPSKRAKGKRPAKR